MANENYTLLKEDIANYLFDYYQMLYLALSRTREPLWKVFSEYMRLANKEENISVSYYQEMVDVFSFYLMKTINSILYDANYKVLSEEDIPINSSIFVNKDDAKMFNSKKQIIRLIRIAICHNDNSNHETYHLKRIDGKLFIEIDLLDVRTSKEKKVMTKPKPFHVLLPLNEYFEIMNKALHSANNNYVFIQYGDNIRNLRGNNCYTLLDDVRIKKCYPMKNRKMEDDDETYIFNNYPNRLFKLSKLQKLKIKEELKEWEKLGAIGYYIAPYLIKATFPLPEFRRPMLEVLLYFMMHYAKYPQEKSLNSIAMDAKKMLQSLNHDNFPINACLKNFDNDACRLCAVQDWDLFVQICCFIYCGYIFDTVVSDNVITINGINVPRNRLRNAIIHSRWASTEGIHFEFFDWNNSMEDEYNKNSPSFWSDFISYEGLQEAARIYHSIITGKELLENEKVLKYKR